MSEGTYNEQLQAARVEYGNAVLDEQAAREGGDLAGVDRAKQAQTDALDTVSKLENAMARGEFYQEETVTLVSPNPRANLTDGAGVTFVDGKAEGVPRSLAEKYTAVEFDGYSIEG